MQCHLMGIREQESQSYLLLEEHPKNACKGLWAGGGLMMPRSCLRCAILDVEETLPYGTQVTYRQRGKVNPTRLCFPQALGFTQPNSQVSFLTLINTGVNFWLATLHTEHSIDQPSLEFMHSSQQGDKMQQSQDQQTEHMLGNPAFYMGLNGGAMKQQQKVNPRFQGMMGQESLFSQGPNGSLGLAGFQSNSHFAPNMEQMLNESDEKRALTSDPDTDSKYFKKARTDDTEATLPRTSAPAVNMTLKLDDEEGAPDPVDASTEGISTFEENDVLSGRGGGTNVHPGNRNFRDLINLHRRSYLKARKNDKPAISRAIVRAIRESGGRFLKKGNKSDLWFEIGDDAAREKTSQALRQRAPEMRKLLFDSERDGARAAAEEQLLHQRMFMGGMNAAQTSGMMWGDHQDGSAAAPSMMNPAFLQAMAANNKLGNGQDPTSQHFSSMFSAALLQNGINRFTSNGA